ncbi:MAG: transglycosylase SLT domain-containing protein [Vicinamibacterales bacterium]
MVRRPFTRIALLALLPLVAACGSSMRKAPIAAAPPGPAAAPVTAQVTPRPAPPVVDPVVTLLAESDRHFAAGQAELEAGHVQGARQEFDRAINVLVESPFGGRTEPRIREQFDRLVDRISTYEVKALAQGDGFTERQSEEPASIDELLAVSASMVPPAASAELANAVKSDIQAGEHDIPIPLNERVLSFIELFQGRLHDFLELGMKRGSKYLPMIQNVFRAEGLPLDLAYVPLVESAFNPNALSRTKARGVWQFMRGTGLENGLRQDWYIDERSDPEKATLAAAKYLNTLASMFKGDWHLALASYNGGPGRVQKALKRSSADDFWELSSRPKLLPRETRDYVPMILAAIVIAKNPSQYGFEFESDEPHSYETVTLDKPVDLRRIAEWADTTIGDIQTLNPELRRWTTPIKDDAYTLKVPVGTSGVVKAKLEDASTADLASLRWYTVKKGETLATIARTLRVSRADLAAANYLKVTARVATGTKLMVPHESTVLMAARAERPVPPTESRPLVARAVVPAVDTSAPHRVKVSYRVKRGDTLATIARAFNTTVSNIKSWNRISGTQIAAGARLTIYTAQAN